MSMFEESPSQRIKKDDTSSGNHEHLNIHSIAVHPKVVEINR